MINFKMIRRIHWLDLLREDRVDQGPFSKTWRVRFEADAKGSSIAEGGD